MASGRAYGTGGRFHVRHRRVPRPAVETDRCLSVTTPTLSRLYIIVEGDALEPMQGDLSLPHDLAGLHGGGQVLRLLLAVPVAFGLDRGHQVAVLRSVCWWATLDSNQ